LQLPEKFPEKKDTSTVLIISTAERYFVTQNIRDNIYLEIATTEHVIPPHRIP